MAVTLPGLRVSLSLRIWSPADRVPLLSASPITVQLSLTNVAASGPAAWTVARSRTPAAPGAKKKQAIRRHTRRRLIITRLLARVQAVTRRARGSAIERMTRPAGPEND